MFAVGLFVLFWRCGAKTSFALGGDDPPWPLVYDSTGVLSRVVNALTRLPDNRFRIRNTPLRAGSLDPSETKRLATVHAISLSSPADVTTMAFSFQCGYGDAIPETGIRVGMGSFDGTNRNISGWLVGMSLGGTRRNGDGFFAPRVTDTTSCAVCCDTCQWKSPASVHQLVDEVSLTPLLRMRVHWSVGITTLTVRLAATGEPILDVAFNDGGTVGSMFGLFTGTGVCNFENVTIGNALTAPDMAFEPTTEEVSTTTTSASKSMHSATARTFTESSSQQSETTLGNTPALAAVASSHALHMSTPPEARVDVIVVGLMLSAFAVCCMYAVFLLCTVQGRARKAEEEVQTDVLVVPQPVPLSPLVGMTSDEIVDWVEIDLDSDDENVMDLQPPLTSVIDSSSEDEVIFSGPISNGSARRRSTAGALKDQ